MSFRSHRNRVRAAKDLRLFQTSDQEQTSWLPMVSNHQDATRTTICTAGWSEGLKDKVHSMLERLVDRVAASSAISLLFHVWDYGVLQFHEQKGPQNFKSIHLLIDFVAMKVTNEISSQITVNNRIIENVWSFLFTMGAKCRHESMNPDAKFYSLTNPLFGMPNHVTKENSVHTIHITLDRAEERKSGEANERIATQISSENIGNTLETVLKFPSLFFAAIVYLHCKIAVASENPLTLLTLRSSCVSSTQCARFSQE